MGRIKIKSLDMLMNEQVPVLTRVDVIPGQVSNGIVDWELQDFPTYDQQREDDQVDSQSHLFCF